MAIIEKININDSQSEASRKIFDNDTRISKQAVNAENKANEALDAAHDANENANKAQESADKAQSSANKAQSTADEAKAQAENAQESADKANQEIKDLKEATNQKLENKTDIEMFFNVSQRNATFDYDDSNAARNAVPPDCRALGQILIYQLVTTGWKQEIFIGKDLSTWSVSENWRSLGGGSRIFEGGRADSFFGGGRIIDSGGADAIFDGELIDCGGAKEY